MRTTLSILVWFMKKDLGRCGSNQENARSASFLLFLSLSPSLLPSLIFPHTPPSTTLLILTTFSRPSSRPPSQHHTTPSIIHITNHPTITTRNSNPSPFIRPLSSIRISPIFSLFSRVLPFFLLLLLILLCSSPSSSLLPLFLLPPKNFLPSLYLLLPFPNSLFLIFFNGFGYGSAHPQVKISPLSYRVSRVALPLSRQSPSTSGRFATVDHGA